MALSYGSLDLNTQYQEEASWVITCTQDIPLKLSYPAFLASRNSRAANR